MTRRKIFTKDEIASRLAPVFARHGVERAVLFGSYAKGRATAWSDIDIAVDSGLKGLEFFGLLGSVCDALPERPIDLIDTMQIERGSRIEQDIINDGVEIYARG